MTLGRPAGGGCLCLRRVCRRCGRRRANLLLLAVVTSAVLFNFDVLGLWAVAPPTVSSLGLGSMRVPASGHTASAGPLGFVAPPPPPPSGSGTRPAAATLARAVDVAPPAATDPCRRSWATARLGEPTAGCLRLQPQVRLKPRGGVRLKGHGDPGAAGIAIFVGDRAKNPIALVRAPGHAVTAYASGFLRSRRSKPVSHGIFFVSDFM
jgi:hypothetical protein